jgi:antirestriction protein ArdC
MRTGEKKDIYQMVTDRIIEQLEAGVVPWTLARQSAGDAEKPLVAEGLSGHQSLRAVVGRRMIRATG